jgi:uncharacterized membrane protein YkvA (DUF1232 family)
MPASIWLTVIGVAGGLLFLWLLLVLMLWRARPEELTVKQSLRLAPDILRLFGRLARKRTVPTAARVRLWLVVAYLASPIDLIPDVIPVIGYADDAIVVAYGIRTAVRHAGAEALRDCWPGTPEGLAAVLRAAGVADPAGPDSG